jgi:predicted enzyme related to lactoylglutathione lyase
MQETLGMVCAVKATAGQFCWVDLAATDADLAKHFYRQTFGWTCHEQPANGGSFTRLRLSDQDVGSMYQLRDEHAGRGVPSHWTPYIQVRDVNETARRVIDFGGKVIVRPFVVSGVAHIALILDSVGAQVGLWEPINVTTKTSADG